MDPTAHPQTWAGWCFIIIVGLSWAGNLQIVIEFGMPAFFVHSVVTRALIRDKNGAGSRYGLGQFPDQAAL